MSRNDKYEIRQCVTCGKPFLANISRNQKYDNQVCAATAWRRKHPERSREIWRKCKKGFSRTVRGYYYSVRRRALNNNIILDITVNQFIEWYDQQPKTCHYCKSPLLSHSAVNLQSESVDRITPSLGYTTRNMVLCCRRCNSIKGIWFSHDEMLKLAKDYLVDKPYTPIIVRGGYNCSPLEGER